MVSDGVFFLGLVVATIGLFWWYPPAAVTACGLVLIALGILGHKGGTRGKTD